MHRPVALSLLSGAGLLVPTAAWAGGTSHPAHPPLSPLFLDRMTVTAYTLGEDPIPGFIPQVIMGVTNEQDSDTSGSGVEGFGIASSTPGGSSLPIGGSPLYVVATLDSGSQSHIISYNDSIPPGFDIQGAGLEGAGSSTIVGISGSETVSITDALGVYATDLSNGSVSNNAINVTPGTLVGHYNVPVLTGNQGDGLPNVVGSPILAQYRVTIQNSQPRHLTVGGTTYKSPRIGFSSFPSTGGVPTNYSKLTLSALDPIFGGAETQPTPYYINFASNGPNDPDTPGAWASLETNGGVGLSRSGQTFGNQSFLLDTGAQLSVISNDTASQVGIFNASPANADFTVDVQGVGGITTVPGYYLDSLNLTTQGGVITWKHVPVLVVDLPNPDGSSTPLPGLLGTNLFSDRDLVLNTDVSHTGQTFIAIGPQLAWTTKGGGTWSTASNWANMPAAPNGIDMQANFYDSITAAATVTVSSPATVGSITFDNANRYTLSGSSAITMSVSADQAQINVMSGSHTIATPLVLASDTGTTIVQAGSTLTISGVVSSSGAAHGLTKGGLGSLQLTGHNSYTGATILQSGTIELGVNARDPILTLAGGADVQGGRLLFDYTSGNDPASTVASQLKTSHASGFATGQIRSTTADATHGLGWKDDSANSQVIVAYSLYGDTNLDGAVGVGDLGALATSYGLTTGANWTQGDFNYDGAVNVGDLGALATNYGLSIASGATIGGAATSATIATGSVSVPEPATFGLMCLAAVLGTSRRRTRRQAR